MNGMGRPSAPLDGIPAVNGHQVMAPLAMPSTLQAVPDGPAPGWPQQDDATPDEADRWWHLQRVQRVMSSHRAWLAAVPIVLVNAVAFTGQLSFLSSHLPWILPGQILVAVTLESVAVYLAWQAHLALAADDSALRLRLAAYGFAAVIGIMNYSHYMTAGWRPTFAAVTFGLMSLSSPWLWSVHSRRASRDMLKAAEQLEPHAVRLGMTRWVWHPVRSWRVMFRATWLGVTKPADAIALLGENTPAAKADETTPLEVAPAAMPETDLEPPVAVTPQPPVPATPPMPVSSHPASDDSSHPKAAVRVTPRPRPRSKVPAPPRRISDADLKKQVEALFAANPEVSLKAAADELGRSRDRVRPLLEQVRAEASR